MTPRIHAVAADADTFFVNAFLIEGEREVVLVDTHFVISSTRRLIARLDALGKKLAAVIVTHPHPDHFNGLPLVLAGRGAIPVFATEPTIAGIRATRAQKREAWTPVYGDDYPKDDALPDHPLGPDAVLDLAGMELRLLDLGGFESALDNTAVHVPGADALIASDLIYNGCHPWLAEHGTRRWLEQLDVMEARFGGCKVVFAGHGAQGDRSLFEMQRRYIQDFRKRVAAVARDGGVAPGEMARLVMETRQGRDGWPLDGLIEMNAAAVAQELASQ